MILSRSNRLSVSQNEIEDSGWIDARGAVTEARIANNVMSNVTIGIRLRADASGYLLINNLIDSTVVDIRLDGSGNTIVATDFSTTVDDRGDNRLVGTLARTVNPELQAQLDQLDQNDDEIIIF